MNRETCEHYVPINCTCEKCDKNKIMTYRQLRDKLSSLSDDILEQTATVYLTATDEYLAISSHNITEEDNDVLDEGHLILEIDF